MFLGNQVFSISIAFRLFLDVHAEDAPRVLDDRFVDLLRSIYLNVLRVTAALLVLAGSPHLVHVAHLNPSFTLLPPRRGLDAPCLLDLRLRREDARSLVEPLRADQVRMPLDTRPQLALRVYSVILVRALNPGLDGLEEVPAVTVLVVENRVNL